MIFPHVPRQYTWQLEAQPKTPLHSVQEPETVDIELWFEQHGLPSKRTDPAAGVYTSSREPIDYWAKDAVEFYALCVLIVCWTMYWWGTHHGVW
jgi:hypothetical protein